MEELSFLVTETGMDPDLLRWIFDTIAGDFAEKYLNDVENFASLGLAAQPAPKLILNLDGADSAIWVNQKKKKNFFFCYAIAY